jgi:hypothetical protein
MRKKKEKDLLRDWMVKKGLISRRNNKAVNLIGALNSQYAYLESRVQEMSQRADYAAERELSLEKQLASVKHALNVLDSVRQGLEAPCEESEWE